MFRVNDEWESRDLPDDGWAGTASAFGRTGQPLITLDAAPLQPAPGAGGGGVSPQPSRPGPAEPAPGTTSRHDVLVTGPSSNRIDIWFVGDGYTADQLDLLIADVQAQFAWMISESIAEPFGAYADFFNVRVVFRPSAEEGADRPLDDVYVDTAFDASYSWNGGVERCLYLDVWAADDAIYDVLGNDDVDMRFGVVNADQYGGCGGLFAVYAAGNEAARDVALHEIGHSFAGLADEYWSPGDGAYSGEEPYQANVTTDPSGAPWAHWLGFDDGVLGPIGAFEGGFFAETGIYRPTDNSLMRSLGRPFDAVARERFVLDFYEEVDPLDAWSFADQAVLTDVYDPFWAEVISSDVIDLEWFVDGQLVSTSATFDLVAAGFGAGIYEVSVRAFDDTPLVRIQQDLLEQTVGWTVEFNYDAQNGTALTDAMAGTAGADRLDGFAGDDIIVGEGGSDWLIGGAGDDVIYGDSADGVA